VDQQRLFHRFENGEKAVHLRPCQFTARRHSKIDMCDTRIR
jgi:hypothetical protein